MQGRFHYHSIIKSIRGKVIFYADSDRLLFLNILRRFTDKYGITVLEFVLMDNHIHILHTAESFIEAGKFVGELQQNFSFWYNRFHSSKDKLFVPAKIYPKITRESVLKCSFYIMQNPMVACPKDYPHPKDYKWSSYHFHYNFMKDVRLMVSQMQEVSKLNLMSRIINNSRSRMKNKCPDLRSGYEWPDVKLSDFLNVSTKDVDSLYSVKEFQIFVQKSLISAKEEYFNERSAKVREYLRNNREVLSKLSDLLVLFLEGRLYESLTVLEKEMLILDLFVHSKATVKQVVILLDEDKNFVSQLYRKSKIKKIY